VKERFSALQSGEVDVLIRNATWTISRDTSLGLNFAPTTFYDGQGFMVRHASGIMTLEDFEGATICVQVGTTTEVNLARVFARRGINYTPLVLASLGDVIEAYEDGQCDGWTADKTGLISAKFVLLSNNEDHKILAETISREPLGPVVRHGDDVWYDVVKSTVFCTILAEELGVNSENVDSMVSSDDSEIRRMLGFEGSLGQEIGLTNDFCYQAIRQNGNYEEIYNRNLGPNTQFDVPRGLNKLWNEGGILISPPFR
jgi:general L-amino acid transport system substrate-binding protein